jgi:hypothetical protein
MCPGHIIHPRSSTYLPQAARAQGSAAAFRDSQKYHVNSGHQHAGYTFIPACVETCGYLGKRIVCYLRIFSAIAASRTLDVSRGSFLLAHFLELSIALVCSQGVVYCASTNLLARASGRPVLEGSDIPVLN